MSRSPTEGMQAPADTSTYTSTCTSAPTGVRGWPQRFGHAIRGARARSPHCTLYLGSKELISWETNRRNGRDAAPAAGSPPAPAPVVFENFEAWCAAHPGAQARIRVSGQLLHSLVADPALRLRDEAAVRAYALQQFTHYHGTQAHQWPLAVWCAGTGSVAGASAGANVNAGASAGACALHSFDLPALQTAAVRHGVRLRSVAPAWSAGLTSLSIHQPSFAGPGLHALALVEGSLLTWLVADAGRIVALQQRYLDAPRTDALADLLDRLIVEGQALAEPPLVIGWGMEDARHTPLLRATVLGPLDDRLAASAWMLDTMNVAA